MRIFRTILIGVLFAALLPWGPYARALSLATASSEPAAAAAAQTAPARVKPVTAHCRIATVPGAPCFPDQVLPSAELAAFHGARDRHALPEELRIAAAHEPGGLLEPPRAG